MDHNRLHPGLRFPMACGVFFFVVLACCALVDVVGSLSRLPGSASTDLGQHFIYWRTWANAQSMAGHIALWNPMIFCGSPFLAGFQSAELYPPHLLYRVVPFVPATNILLVAHLSLLACGMMWWCRSRGSDWVGALVAAISVMFSGTVFLRLYAGHICMLYAMAWTPWVLGSTGALACGAGWRCFLCAAGASAMQILTGSPQIVFLAWLVAAALSMIQLVGQPRWFRYGFAIAAALALGSLLASAQLLPGLAIVSETTRAGGLSHQAASIGSLSPHSLLTALNPWAAGIASSQHPFAPNDWGWLGEGAAWEQQCYGGTVMLCGAIYGLIEGSQWRRWAIVALAAVLLTIALGGSIPLYGSILDAVPMLGYFRAPARFVFPAILLMALLASQGITRLRAGSPKHQFIRPILLGLAMCVAALAAHPGARTPTLVGAAIAVASIGLMLLVCGRPSQSAAGGLIIGACTAEMMLFAWSGRASMEYPPQPDHAWEQSIAHVAGAERILWYGMNGTNAGIVRGIPNAYGYDPLMLLRYGRLAAAGEHGDWNRLSDRVGVPMRWPDGLLQLMRCSVRQFGSGPGIPVPHPMPRAMIFAAYRFMPNENEQIRAILDSAFSPWDGLILGSRPSVEPVAGASGSVRCEERSPDELVLHVEVDKAAILLITDAYARGWIAEDRSGRGRSYEVIPADYLMRAVPLEAGTHEITMVYRPSAWTWGVWLSTTGILVSLTVAVAGLISDARNRHRLGNSDLRSKPHISADADVST